MHPLFQELSYATRRMITADNALLKNFGITYSQWVFIVYLHNNKKSSLAPIARYYQIQKPAVTVTKNIFLKKGWIREEAGKDQREKIISLTPEGESHFEEINTRVRAMEKQFFSALDESEQRHLQEMLYRINAKGDLS